VRVRILHLTSAAVLALSLGGCLRDPYVTTDALVTSGSWRIERQPDRVTGASIGSALTSAMASNTVEPFPQRATLQLLCFLDKPVANFRFPFKIGTDTNSFIGYRFDEKPGHEIGGHFMPNAASVAIEDPADVAQFVSELSTSNVLYVRIRSLTPGALP
jgi:predicted acylesterase/phospholipase RssA